MEQASVEQRIAKALNAGVDQLGGFGEPSRIVAVVKSGAVSERRLDDAAYRLLVPRFQLGLFENPYVDPAEAGRIVGKPEFQRMADQAQRNAIVLLNKRIGFAPPPGGKVYLRGIGAAVAQKRGFTVVQRPEDADFALMRLGAPYERLHPGYFFGFMQHEGDLDYKPADTDLVALREAAARVPTVVAVDLDRPAIVTPLRDAASMLLVTFGASDDALLDVVVGTSSPNGRLPFELPSSMMAVRAQNSALPHDSRAPLYPIFYRHRPRPGAHAAQP
jgi:beta-glucosidase